MKKSLLIIIASFSVTLPSQLLSCEQYFPALYIGSAALETLSLMSKDIRHMIYGNNTVDKSTQKVVHNILESHYCDLPQRLDIKESRSLWPKIAGNIFSNHDSLFISKDAIKEIESNASLTDQTKRELIKAALMIHHKFDTKILAASIVTPMLIWASIHSLNALLQKINTDDKNTVLKKITSVVKQCKESFKIKSLITLIILGFYVLYKRYDINAATTVFLL